MPAPSSVMLPPNSTPWERAVSGTSAAQRMLDSDIIRRYKDPWQCPEHLLPYLAFERSVDIWRDDWSVSKKRSVIAHAFENHRLKGSVEGIRRYIEIADGRLRRYRKPPEGIFADDPDEEQREAWLARFAQVRVFTHRLREEDRERCSVDIEFAGGTDETGTFDGFFAGAPLGAALGGRSGVLWDHGVSMPLIRYEDVVADDDGEIIIEHYAVAHDQVGGYFAGVALDGDYVDEAALAPVLTIEREPVSDGPRILFQRNALRFRGPFIDVSPELVREAAADPAGFYAGIDYASDGYAEDGIDPATLVYERWRVYDAARSGGLPGTGWYFADDPTWFSLEAFTLILDIEVDEALPTRTVIDGAFEGDFLLDHDASQTDFIIQAVNSARADRDKALIRFAHHRPVRLDDKPTLPFRLDALVKD